LAKKNVSTSTVSASTTSRIPSVNPDATPAPIAAPAPTRVFQKQSNLMHDLHKLLMGKSFKYIGWREGGEYDNPLDNGALNTSEWTTIEHCHFFHTIDSKGTVQSRCTPINGHFHDISIVQDGTADSPPVYKVGPAKKEVLKKVNGKLRKTIIEVPYDGHTHKMEYLRSEILKPRSISAEAAQSASLFMTNSNMKEPEPVTGILG